MSDGPEVAGPFSQPPGDEGPPEEDFEDPDDGAEPLPEGFSGDVLVRPPPPARGAPPLPLDPGGG